MLEPSSPPGPDGEEAASDPQEESPSLGTKQEMGPGDSEGQASDDTVPP